MSNLCIIAKNQISVEERDACVLDAFFAVGYDFDEARILPLSDGEKLRKCLAESKAEYENILLLTEEYACSSVREWIKNSFPVVAREGKDGGIYTDQAHSLVLLPLGNASSRSYVVETVLPYLQNEGAAVRESVCVRAIGASQSRAKALLADVEGYAEGKIRLRHRRNYDEDIFYATYGNDAPKMLVDGVVRRLVEGLGDTVYALNDVSIEEQLVTLLKVRGKKLSVAESFTGGGIARRITSVSGASEVYYEGLNTYDERSKTERLGVSEYTLKTVGAVSDETAYQMALGLLSGGNCDISIATTGLAGPNSDKSMLPVGLSYIAVGTKEKIFVYRYKFEGDRKEITEKAIEYALFLAYKKLKEL